MPYIQTGISDDSFPEDFQSSHSTVWINPASKQTGILHIGGVKMVIQKGRKQKGPAEQ